MGTAELYRIVEEFDDVVAAAAVDEGLRKRLLLAIRTRLSARLVPDEVYAIAEVPRTLTGKKLEVPVKRILLGHPVDKAVNRDSTSNPWAIDWFVAFGRARQDRPTSPSSLGRKLWAAWWSRIVEPWSEAVTGFSAPTGLRCLPAGLPCTDDRRLSVPDVDQLG